MSEYNSPFPNWHGTTIVAVATPRERPNVSVGETIGVVLPPESCVVLQP